MHIKDFPTRTEQLDLKEHVMRDWCRLVRDCMLGEVKAWTFKMRASATKINAHIQPVEQIVLVLRKTPVVLNLTPDLFR